jgi:SAM-dependent methyltransferase
MKSRSLARKGWRLLSRSKWRALFFPLAAGIHKPSRLVQYACDLLWEHSERKMGIETYGNLSKEFIRQFCDDANAYTPTSYINLPQILSFINPGDVFIDIGCGKGRVIWFLGSRIKLKKIIGFEIVPELAEEAKRKLMIYQRTLKCPVDIIEGDASSVDLSQGNVFYLYNSFGEKTVSKLLANIERSLFQNKRRIRIIYMNPLHGNLLDSSSWLHPTANAPPFRIWIAISTSCYREGSWNMTGRVTDVHKHEQ